jgi:hypothetical protein
VPHWTALVPRLWSDPLGPMLKLGPLIMLNLIVWSQQLFACARRRKHRHPVMAPGRHHITLDLARTTDTSEWKGVLADVDAVINVVSDGQCFSGARNARSAR